MKTLTCRSPRLSPKMLYYTRNLVPATDAACTYVKGVCGETQELRRCNIALTVAHFACMWFNL